MEKEPIKFSMAYLQALIKESGFTLAGFAEKMGMHEVSLSRKLRGETAWSQADIYKAVQILGIEDPLVIKNAFLTIKK